MNKSSFLGLGLAVAVLYLGVFHGAKNPAIFLDAHALILVVGGTVAAATLAFPIRDLLGLVDFVTMGVFSKTTHTPLAMVDEIRQSSEVAKSDPRYLKTIECSHPFLTEGLRLVGENILGPQELYEVLDGRKESFRERYMQDVQILNAIAKYPPAFGLLGASTGMISMMTNLGTGGTAAIGSSMAVALVATFWGIAAANLVILPLADYAQKVVHKDQAIRQLILDGVMMIKTGEDEQVMIEKLRSSLVIKDRIQVSRRTSSSYNTANSVSQKGALRVVTNPGSQTHDADTGSKRKKNTVNG